MTKISLNASATRCRSGSGPFMTCCHHDHRRCSDVTSSPLRRRCVEQRLVVADRPRELVLEPQARPDSRRALDLRVVGAERRLRQESRGLGGRDRRVSHRSGRRLRDQQETQPSTCGRGSWRHPPALREGAACKGRTETRSAGTSEAFLGRNRFQACGRRNQHVIGRSGSVVGGRGQGRWNQL